MAGRNAQTFKKTQKEQQRKEKRQEKLARRLERKRNGPNPVSDGAPQQMDDPGDPPTLTTD